MRVGDQICGGRKDEATRAKCRQLLKRYGLDESVEKCYPFELSGGMARRVPDGSGTDAGAEADCGG